MDETGERNGERGARIGAGGSTPLWTSLEIAKLLVGVATPVMLLAITLLVDARLRETARTAERQEAMRAFAEAVYDRRTRAALLASGLRRHAATPVAASVEEIRARKAAYDEAYAAWNATHQSNLFLIRQMIGADSYSGFEAVVEFGLVSGLFAPLDRCLTEAWDAAVRERDPRPVLSDCDASGLLGRALDCGYAVTDALFRMASDSRHAREGLGRAHEACPGAGSLLPNPRSGDRVRPSGG